MILLPSLAHIATLDECHARLKSFGFLKKRRPVTPKVAGSSPVAPAMFSLDYFAARLKV
jgi:hypothetical protein